MSQSAPSSHLTCMARDKNAVASIQSGENVPQEDLPVAQGKCG